MKKAAKAYKMIDRPICEVKRRHILARLDYCRKKIPRWSNARYNKYRAYLLMLYKELVHVKAVEFNPIRDIIRKKQYKKIREVLSPEQRTLVNNFLQENIYTFWRFLHIFFHSGARETELMGVTKEKVFLREQYFIVTTLKRGGPTEVRKPIKTIIKHLWEEIYNSAAPGDFLFAKNLQPGKVKISAWQISRRWREHAKKKLGITADFCCLKHMNLDEVEDILSMKEAVKMASHLSTSTTEIYTVGKQQRDLVKLQNIENSFA